MSSGASCCLIQIMPEIRHDAEHRDPGQLFKLAEAGLQKRRIPAELVDDKATSIQNPSVDDHHDIISDAPVYDLNGLRVQGTPKKGVYIQNGVKRVVR